MNEKGVTIWFTGLSASGKTTISLVLEKILRGRGLKVEMLDGDVVRTNLSKGLGFSKEDRDTNILRIGYVCNLLTRNGVIAIAAAISPYREIRDANRSLITDFLEVFIDTPIDECIKRDPKGMYKKAIAGEIKEFTGISDPYEPPLNPEVTLNTCKLSPENCAVEIIAKLVELGYLEPEPENSVYTSEEEKIVKKRLQDLGYI